MKTHHNGTYRSIQHDYLLASKRGPVYTHATIADNHDTTASQSRHIRGVSILVPISKYFHLRLLSKGNFERSSATDYYVARMGRVQFQGPALTMSGTYEMEDTSGYLGYFNADWSAKSFGTENQSWLRIFNFMENQMENLISAGLEFTKPFLWEKDELAHGYAYLWHVARKMATMWRGGLFQQLSIFEPMFRRTILKSSNTHDVREEDPILAAEANPMVKAMRFDWSIDDRNSQFWAQEGLSDDNQDSRSMYQEPNLGLRETSYDALLDIVLLKSNSESTRHAATREFKRRREKKAIGGIRIGKRMRNVRLTPDVQRVPNTGYTVKWEPHGSEHHWRIAFEKRTKST